MGKTGAQSGQAGRKAVGAREADAAGAPARPNGPGADAAAGRGSAWPRPAAGPGQGSPGAPPETPPAARPARPLGGALPRPGVLDRRLEYFCAVCQAGSITRAAEGLEMSQPALSQAMRALEEDAGVTLLRRTRRGVEPTEAGALVLDAAEQAARDIGRALEAAARPGARLVVGANLHACGIVCAKAGPAFKRACPEVALSVRDLPGNDTVAEGVAAGCEVVESVFSPGRSYPPGVSYRRMLEAETVLCVPPDDPLASLDRPLEMGDLDGKTLCIYRQGVTDAEDAILEAVRRSGANVSLVLCDDGEYSHMDYLVNGWIAPSLSAVADRRRPAVPLRMADPVSMEIGLFTIGEPSPAAQRFVEEAQALFSGGGEAE